MMFKKIRTFFFGLRMYIAGKILFWKYRFRNKELLAPIQCNHTYKSREMREYCLKLLENPNYKYTTYSEQMMYNSFLELAEESNCKVSDIAFLSLEIMFGALGMKLFD